MSTISKRAAKRARGAARATKREDTGACICQSVTLVASPSGLSFRYVKSRTRTIRAHCRHWCIVDAHTGRLTEQPVSPRIGGQPKYGMSRASHKSMTSPWNRQGPSLAQMR